MSKLAMTVTTFVSALTLAAPVQANGPSICYDYHAVDVPPELSTEGTTWFAVNNRGLVVGNAANADGTAVRGYTYDIRRGTFEAIDPPAGWVDIWPADIDNRGRTVGYVSDFSKGLFLRAFIRDRRGEITILPAPDLNRDAYGASGMNDRGQIVGFVLDPDQPGVFFRGLVWDSPRATPRVYDAGEGQTAVSDISNRGTLIGRLDRRGLDGTYRVFRDKGQGPVFFDPVPSAALTEAFHFNTRGHIVGYYKLEDPGDRFGYVKTRFGTRLIDFPGATATEAQGINAFGTVVGSYNGFTRGFIAFPYICFD